MAEPFTLYKLIILYMLSRVDYPLTNSQISEFILDREYTGYFQLQQALSEMIDSRLVSMETIRNTSYYRITDTGNTTLDYFVDEISRDIRRDINAFLEENDCQLREEVAATADYWKLTGGACDVRLMLHERSARLIDLTIRVPGEEAARSACARWRENSQEIYGRIIDFLL